MGAGETVLAGPSGGPCTTRGDNVMTGPGETPRTSATPRAAAGTGDTLRTCTRGEYAGPGEQERIADTLRDGGAGIGVPLTCAPYLTITLHPPALHAQSRRSPKNALNTNQIAKLPNHLHPVHRPALLHPPRGTIQMTQTHTSNNACVSLDPSLGCNCNTTCQHHHN